MLRTRSSSGLLSLGALLLGLALGILGHASGAPVFGAIETVIRPFGDLWLAALQLLLLPLIITQVLSAVAGSGAGAGEVSRLGARALLLIVTMLLVVGAITAIVSRPLAAALYQSDPLTPTSLRVDTSIVGGKALTEGRENSRLPTNLVEAARRGDILPLLIFSALLGAAVTRLKEPRREPLVSVLGGIAEAVLEMTRWILLGTPVGVFVLCYSSALQSGEKAAGMMWAFVLLVCGLLGAFTLLLYPVTALTGRITMRAFAKAVAPAQLVAVSTLSSIAALPALLRGGADDLKLPPRINAFVLPLCVSIFKQSRAVSATAKLMFLAHVYAIPVDLEVWAVFMLTVAILSFSAVGVPGGGTAFSTLPAYLAAGLPLEGIIVLEATSMVTDASKTLLNVTADLSVGVILSRSDRAPVPEATRALTVPPAAPQPQ